MVSRGCPGIDAPPKKPVVLPAFFLSELEPFRRLKDRDLASEGLVIAEGPYLVERLLASRCPPRAVVCLPDLESRFLELARGRCPVRVLDRDAMRGLVGFPFHRGALACAERPPLAELATITGAPGRSLVVVCPDLNDDANIGLVMRSALAFGAAGAILGTGSADPWSRRSLRLSMGASLFLPVARYTDGAAAADALVAARYRILGTANRPEATPLSEVARPERVAVLIGNEGSGLSAAWLDRCHEVARIPMESVLDSLGASVAAGIVLYAMSGRG